MIIKNSMMQDLSYQAALIATVVALASVIVALALYIRKMHNKSIGLTERCITVMSEIKSAIKANTDQTERSGDQMTDALDKQTRAFDDLHKYILGNTK